MTIQSRQYRDEADYARMRALLVESYAIDPRLTYFTVGDLDWWRSLSDGSTGLSQIQLWLDEQGAVLGFGWPGEDGIDMMTHPHHRPIEDEMLGWAEARAAQRGLHHLQAWSYAGDEFRNALLERRGYEPTERSFFLLGRGLEEPAPAPPLPDGYLVRNVYIEDDLAQRVAVHRDAFAPSRMTEARYLEVTRLPTYRPALDLVVEAPDESLAAFCIVWLDEANRFGMFEPVGCHSAHRRRGLARAVMCEGLRRLRALGARSAYVGSDGDNAAATQLYESIGFAVIDRNRAWRHSS